MTRNVNEQVKEYGRRRRFRSRWAKLLGVMACMVVFCTTYALILPAITLDSTAVCGMDEHTHGPDCWEQVLVCEDESSEHVHTEDCYERVLTCQILEHTHSERCYAEEAEPETADQTDGATEPLPEEKTEGETGEATEPLPEEKTEGETDGATEPLPEEKTEGETGEATEPPAEEETEGETEAPAEEKPEGLVLTEQTVDATVYTDAGYTSLYAEPATITLKGLLPEGVVAKTYPVSVTLDDETVTVVEAYDIGLFVTTAEGEEKEYEPDSRVEVKITSEKLKDVASVNVYHIDDADDANPNPQPELVTDGIAVGEDNEVTFDADRFSTYVVASADDGIALASITGDNTVSVGSNITLTCNSRNCGNGTWSSSNNSVAKVNGSGDSARVTGVSAGTVTISHTHRSGYNQATSTYTVTVTGSFNDNYSGNAALYFLSDPKGDPIDNNSGSWLPAQDKSSMLGQISTDGATWENGNDSNNNVIPNKNITRNPADYITAWPDGTTGAQWVVNSTGSSSSYFQTILNWVWNNYQSSIQEELGLSISKDDITQLILTPRKISRDNGGKYPYHIDCSLAIKSDKVYMARFWVLEPDGYAYSQVAAKNYKTGDLVENAENKNYYKYEHNVGDTKEVGGTTYIMTGWYTEDETGLAPSNKKAEFAYTPSDGELKDAVVNFYAKWVPATNGLTIVKYEKGDTTKLLPGAVFTLTNTSDSNKTYTFEATGKDGETTLNGIAWGEYTLSETTAPTNYQKISDITVIVGDTVTIDANDAKDTGAEMKDGKLYIPNELATVDVTLKKVDSADSKLLSGAVFTLTDQDGKYYSVDNSNTVVWSDTKTEIKVDNGTYTFSGLKVGQYTLTEVKAPDGYNLLTETVTITVASDGKVTATNGNTVEQNGDGSYTVTVKNTAGTTLPNTGGMGTTMYTTGGLILMAVAMAGCLMYSGRKRREGGVE